MVEFGGVMARSMESLNRIDRHILQKLQNDGRMSYAELARQVGLTTTPCIERVKRLEKEGYIQGYGAQLNADYLDAGLIVFIQIRLERTSKDNFDRFKQSVELLPEVQECYLVTGQFDFLIKTRLANMASYREFLEETLLAIPSIQGSTTVVVMETVKETLAIPISYR